MGYIGMRAPKGYGLSAVLVRVWFLHSNLELGMSVLLEANFSLLSVRPSTKDLHKLCLLQLCQPQGS